MSSEASKSNYYVNSVEKGFTVLKAFTASNKQLTLVELAKITNINKATVRRFALTLVDLGYLKITEENKFQITSKILEFTNLYLKTNDIHLIAQPIIKEITNITQKTTNIATLDKNDIVYIGWSDSPFNLLNQNLTVGSRLPYYSTAIGKAITAWFPYEKRKELWDSSNIVAFTENTITSFEKLEMEGDKIRKNGYAFSNQEYSEGLISLAVPIFDFFGNAIAALNISNYSVKNNNDEFIREYLPILKGKVKLISSLIGTMENEI